MNLLRSVLLAFLLITSMVLSARSANAALLQGNSTGTFSNISHCWGTCYVFDGVTEPDTVLGWGFGLFTNGSMLVAQQRQWNVDVENANDVILAELSWKNRATSDWLTPDLFKVDYTLNIKFSKPDAVSDTEVFKFSIMNTKNPAGDHLMGLTLADLAGLSFALNGIEMSDLKYQLTGAGSFDGSYWSNPEGKMSTMYITADFKSTPPVSDPVQVPEPAPLMLIALGLLGVGLQQRRKAASTTV